MSVQVILLNDVANLGKAGEEVHVADGYARNYLIPRKLAGPVTQATMKRLEKLRKEREELARLQLAEAKAKAAKLKDINVTVRAKTTDGTNLYGSVRVEDIVSAIGAQGVDIDRTQIGLEAPITAVGQFDVPVKLHADVSVTLKVWVVEA
jgi:large subunit ribosomal protein L9